MPPSVSPLDQPASIPVLRRLVAADVVPREEGLVLEQRIRRALPWAAWLDRALLVLGVVLIVFGIGYFFAHHWSHLTDSDKLVLAGGAVLAALGAATTFGFERFPGKLLLLVASLLVGIFLAVFGTIYQSTVEDYAVVLRWALLITPWVILGRFPALWIVWLYLLNIALFLYWQILVPSWDSYTSSLERQASLSLVLFNLGALALRELAAHRGVAWLDRGWSALIILAGIYFAATGQAILEILTSTESTSSLGTLFLALLIYSALVGLTYWHYVWVRPSLPALAIGTLGCCVTLTSLAGRMLFNNVRGDPIGQMFFMGVITLSVFGAGVYFLRETGRQFAVQRRNVP